MSRFFMIFSLFVYNCILTCALGQNLKVDTGLANVSRYSLIEFSRPFSADSILITAFVEIPFQSLQFVKKEKTFISYYDVSIILEDEKGKRVFRKMWSDSILTQDYLRTQSRFRSKKYYSNIKVVKGEFTLKSELYDKDTRKKGLKKIRLDLSKKDKKPFLFNPIVITNLKGYWGFNKNEFPITGKRVTNIDDGLTLIFSGFVDLGPYDIGISYGDGDDTKNIILDKEKRSEGFFLYRYKLNKEDLYFVNENIVFFIKQGSKEKSITKNISIYKPGLSGFVNNVETSFRQMKYILTADEIKKSKGIKGKDLEKLFLSFWKDRDPTPTTNANELMEEYYIRVNYVNEYFKMSWKEGWETDMGMIYIMFGPPDQIERSNPSSMNSTLYQIWYFNRINRQFVFKDQNGFGDFRLDKPFFGSNF